MTELTIRPDEIRDAIERNVAAYAPETAREEVGRVMETGDGIARVEGLHSAMTNELLEFEGGLLGLALNLDVREIGVVLLGDGVEDRGGPAGPPHRRDPLGARSATATSAASSTRSATRSTARARSSAEARRALELQAPVGRAAPAGEGADADRHQGHRRHDRDRPRPAPADHRRPADRQDRGRDRHDHQPAGELGVRRPDEAGQVHLRGHRPEGLDDRGGPRRARGGRRDGVHHHRRGPGLRPGRLQVPGPVHRLGHRPALDVPGPARPDHLRRPVQAGRGLPRRVAAAAPPAGPRGLPR